MARYDGNKSWSNLLLTANGLVYRNELQNSRANYSVKRFFTSFAQSGNYRYSYGGIDARNSEGFFWTSKYQGKYTPRALRITLNVLNPYYYRTGGIGYSLRRVAKSPLLSTKPARRKSPKTSQNLSQQSA